MYPSGNQSSGICHQRLTLDFGRPRRALTDAWPSPELWLDGSLQVLLGQFVVPGVLG